MARGVNKVIIVGNLGKEPESKQLPSGGLVTTMSVATSESWKDKNTGENRYTTEILADELQMLDSKGDNNAVPSTKKKLLTVFLL